MTVHEQQINEIIEKLERGREKVHTVKEERDKLLTANRMLVKIVKKLEKTIEEKLGRKALPSLDEFNYSYGSGWQTGDITHGDALELGDDPDIEELEEQINEIIRTLNKT